LIKFIIYLKILIIIMKTNFSLGRVIEIGLDEAGRGCFWGPIYAGAVIWPHDEDWTDKHREISPFIKDSKKIPEKRRHVIAEGIKSLASDWGVGKVSAAEIDEKGVTWANQESFRRAIGACSSDLKPDLLLIDGVLGLPRDQVYGDVKFQCIPGGDGLYLPIAAASILAKVSRDTFVKEWSVASEENKAVAARYDLIKNKGYGTAKHRDALKTHGADEEHRTQYIRNWI
jgi:ribonuclease HII